MGLDVVCSVLVVGGTGLAKDQRGSFFGFGRRSQLYRKSGSQRDERQDPPTCAADESRRFFPRTWRLYALLE